jgi:protein SCO1
MSKRLRLAPLAIAASLAVAVAIAAILVGSSGRGSSSSQTSSSSSPGSYAGSSSGSTGSSSGSAIGDSQSGFDGAALPANASVHDFTLLDQAGRKVSLSSYRGQVAILAFLYPTCGRTCVLIADQIRGALEELAHPVPVLIVSADPAEDDPASVSRFLAEVSLTGRALYLSGSEAELQLVWHAYRVAPPTAGRGAFERRASVYLLDRHGRARVLFELEQLTPEALAHDIGKLQTG